MLHGRSVTCKPNYTEGQPFLKARTGLVQHSCLVTLPGKCFWLNTMACAENRGQKGFLRLSCVLLNCTETSHVRLSHR